MTMTLSSRTVTTLTRFAADKAKAYWAQVDETLVVVALLYCAGTMETCGAGS